MKSKMSRNFKVKDFLVMFLYRKKGEKKIHRNTINVI